MIELGLALKNWKAESGQREVVISLYEISITDEITVRLIEGNPLGGPITFDSNVYTPASIQRTDVEQAVTGELGNFQLQVSNIDGIAGGYIERYELEGRRVTIRTYAFSDPDNPFVETWTIQNQAYTREVASITLGYGNLFKRKLPWRRYERPRCLHDWENRFIVGNGCGFPSDEFEEDTRQSFKIGGTTDSEQRRQYRWYTLNILKATNADVSITELSGLFLGTSSSDADWAGDQRNGPFVYQKITGDFDVYTRCELINARDSGMAGILCQEDLDGDSWVFLAREKDTGEAIKIVASASIDGSQEAATELEDPNPRYLRMRRVGDVFSLYTSTLENASWALLEDRTVAMTPEIRIGLAVGGGVGLSLAASFPFFRFTAGGPSTCDRTIEGDDGCRLKDNIHRNFSFPGIPRR